MEVEKKEEVVVVNLSALCPAPLSSRVSYSVKRGVREVEKREEEEPPLKKAGINQQDDDDDGGEKGRGGGGGGGGFDLIGEDIHRNILSRLPALSYAYAACVDSSWNRLCNQILLSRPKLLSAISFHPCLETAVNEALDKVLSEPIRPDFAIACVGSSQRDSLEESHNLVRKRLSSTIPIISSLSPGIIGSHVHTNNFIKMKWVEDEIDYINACGDDDLNFIYPGPGGRVNDVNGVVVIVGFMPGMKVNAIPYLQSSSVRTKVVLKPPEVSMIEKFVTGIMDYSTSVSGCTSPAAIIMFADHNSNLEPVLRKMDYALSEETVIMGDETGCFMYNNGDDCRAVGEIQRSQDSKCAAVALVFAMNKDKPCGVGEIQFNLAMSTGVSPVGPTFKGDSVGVTKVFESFTWLTARTEGSIEELGGDSIFQYIKEIENDISLTNLHIGVTKRRKCSFGTRKKKLVSSLAFHKVSRVDEAYLYVEGEGIKDGDSFRFYKPDPLVSYYNVSEELKILKLDCSKEVFGGIILCCYGRAESFFIRRNAADSSAFLENYPGVPLGGIFCCGGFGFGLMGSSSYSSVFTRRKNEPVCSMHVYGTVYLVMSYTPKPLAMRCEGVGGEYASRRSVPALNLCGP